MRKFICKEKNYLVSKTNKSEKVPQKMQAAFDGVTELTDEFCRKHLNDEYARLARRVSAALCRKRPSPLLRGPAKTWACGIVYTLGFVNFLFDKSQDPHMSAADLCKEFGVSKSTGGAKAKAVREALNMSQLDSDWCLPSMMDNNPLAWLIMVDGFTVDARTAPREIQEIAFHKGLIPYIPCEKGDKT